MKKVSEYNQGMPQSQTAGKPKASRERDNSKKTIKTMQTALSLSLFLSEISTKLERSNSIGLISDGTGVTVNAQTSPIVCWIRVR